MWAAVARASAQPDVKIKDKKREKDIRISPRNITTNPFKFLTSETALKHKITR